MRISSSRANSPYFRYRTSYRIVRFVSESNFPHDSFHRFQWNYCPISILRRNDLIFPPKFFKSIIEIRKRLIFHPSSFCRNFHCSMWRNSSNHFRCFAENTKCVDEEKQMRRKRVSRSAEKQLNKMANRMISKCQFYQRFFVGVRRAKKKLIISNKRQQVQS